MKSMRFAMDRGLADKDTQLAHLGAMLKDKTGQVTVLQKYLLEMQNRWQDAKEDMKKWKKRCELLEKTRRLGYYTPGKGDSRVCLQGGVVVFSSRVCLQREVVGLSFKIFLEGGLQFQIIRGG